METFSKQRMVLMEETSEELFGVSIDPDGNIEIIKPI